MGVVRVTSPVFFLKFALIISLEMVKLGTSNFVCWLIHKKNSAWMINYPNGDRFRLRDLFKFWEIIDNISETVQRRDIVAMED